MTFDIKLHIENLQNGFSVYLQSESIGKLTLALCKAQSKMPLGLRKYKNLLEDFSIIVTATMPILMAYDLKIFQDIRIDQNANQILSTILLHKSSGQWIETRELVGLDIDEKSLNFIHLRMQSYIAMSGIVIPKRNWNDMLSLQKGYREISWSQINLFLQCPRCFYRSLRKGKKRPGVDPESFRLPKKIEEILKNEMNIFRGWKAHPRFMSDNGIDAIPFCDSYNSITKWQTTLRKKNNTSIYDGGIRFYDHQTNFILYGSVDDVWINNQGEFIIVEYKTTAKDVGACIKDDYWYMSYQHQVSFYAWLFKKNGYKVHKAAYFLYINGGEDQLQFLPFDGNLKCYLSLSNYHIDDSWIERTIQDMRDCLNQSIPPKALKNSQTNRICEYCDFARSDKD